ncbi:glycosyltransferase [Pantoea sp. Bo_2]|uniref:Glycosyltransferase n=1 Tax=Candidatus Pantoea gossypiicola TaxID=2608008 RepID=A0AB34CPV2_9GAMM|nr:MULTISPECIES: glycosyltransferase [Pantoea]KAA5929374.1 glycosyltransferase [Pantoea sp. VH_8]KAA5934627.1 glycosyltransferase [Pantoea sp. VH_4]KAA5951069.1 glycosyltransferase [Pantoea sp. VH_3]KAA5956416.1 glycosyltransferase [Pantoea sp. VH_25]KAA5959436.1 glycosyltransferase [Pantoea sp. VH_24]
MSDILLSVIIPTYNVEKYIVECVDSLLRQVKAPNEIIIVNDGSTDGTLALIEQNYTHLSQVKVITIENGGLGNARDTGIALAQGQFIFFCDPDDVVVDGLVTELAMVAEKHPETDLFCFNSCVYEDGHIDVTSPKVRHDHFGQQKPQEVFLRLLRNGRYTSAVWNYVLRKSVIEQHKLRFVRRVHEDHNFTLSVFMKCQHAWVSRQVYYKQRIRSGSLTNSTKGNEFFYQRYDAFMHAYNTLVSSLPKSDWRNSLEKAYLLQSFRLMIYLSLYNGTPVPEYVINAIRFMGRNVKTENIKEWLLFNRPELFIALQHYKVKKELRGAA